MKGFPPPFLSFTANRRGREGMMERFLNRSSFPLRIAEIKNRQLHEVPFSFWRSWERRIAFFFSPPLLSFWRS